MRNSVSFTKSFVLTVLLAFGLSFALHVVFLIPKIKTSIVELQSSVSSSERDLAARYIEQYLLDRLSVLNDIAKYPMVKNGVMGSGIHPEDLNDFLNENSILGERGALVLLNIEAEPVYVRGEVPDVIVKSTEPWFSKLLSGELSFELNLVARQNSNRFQLAVPVDLNGLVEGVLLAELSADLENILSLFISEDERAITLEKAGVQVSSGKYSESDSVTFMHTIDSMNLDMRYQVNSQFMTTQLDRLLWSILSSIIFTMGVTLVVIVVSGNITVIAPYRRLQQLTEERNKAKLDAEESARVKGEFLASMSHEIRTPLNGVLGMLRLLSKGDLSGQQLHYVTIAKSSAESLLSLINDILDFSKIEARKLDLESLEFDLNVLLEDFVNSMAFRAHEKNIELILDTSQVTHSYVEGDPGRIRQILTNLVGNSIKFTEGGEVVIRVELQKDEGQDARFVCSVTDTGIGIASEKQSYLFESFVQVDASNTRKYGGTGLGLAIVKQLCELMGGEVSVRSQEGIGSVFTFNIGLKLSDRVVKNMEVGDIRNHRILIVDDNATNREVLRLQLESWGAEVVEAIDGPSALTILKQSYDVDGQEPFSVAILDMQMPGMDGGTLGKKIRSNRLYKDIRLVMMTSVGERGDGKFFSDIGFSAYFTKPATPSELYRALLIIVNGEDRQGESQPFLNRHNLYEINTGATLGMADCFDKGNRVLLVEDNVINQEVALGLLDDLGLTADTANNGVEALVAIQSAPRAAPYDLILMDCQMPEMDGYEATRKIRDMDLELPIVAMTANAMKGDREKCLDSGMNDYLSKPIDPGQMEMVLAKWLKNRKLTENLPTQETSNPAVSMVPNAERVDDVVWDKASLMKRLKNREDRLLVIVKLYIDNIPIKINTLRQAIDAGDTKEIKEISHAIKGSVANLGALKLRKLTEEMEQNAQNLDQANIIWEGLNQQFVVFTRLMKDVLKELEAGGK